MNCLCCAVLCCAVLCCAVLCCAVVCCGVLCCAVLWCGVLWCGVLCCGVLCSAVLCSAVLCCAVVCCTVLWCALVWCAVLCSAVQCCAVLYCGVVWCVVVCCAVVWCGVLWCAVLWCGVLWCGVVCCGAVWRAVPCRAVVCCGVQYSQFDIFYSSSLNKTLLFHHDRVPGNFHIEARSKHHNLNPETSNVSHIVNHLSFGKKHFKLCTMTHAHISCHESMFYFLIQCFTLTLPNTAGPILSKGAVTKLEQMPKELFDLRNTESMDGNGYVSKQLHQAFHHYIKVMVWRGVLCAVVYCAVM